MKKSRQILNEQELQALLQKLAAEISETEKTQGPFHLVGIHRRGVILAKRLLSLLEGPKRKLGSLDINLYRDDFAQSSTMPVLRETKIDFPVEKSRILLIDDVLFTGRTIRSALNAMMDLGRPQKVDLLVLVDRGGRELPIQADLVGLKLEVSDTENVAVRLKEIDKEEGVWLLGGNT